MMENKMLTSTYLAVMIDGDDIFHRQTGASWEFSTRKFLIPGDTEYDRPEKYVYADIHLGWIFKRVTLYRDNINLSTTRDERKMLVASAINYRERARKKWQLDNQDREANRERLRWWP